MSSGRLSDPGTAKSWDPSKPVKCVVEGHQADTPWLAATSE